LLLGLDDGAHVMVIREPKATSPKMLGDVREPRTELGPFVDGELGSLRETLLAPAVDAAARLGHDHHATSHGEEQVEMILHLLDLLARRASTQLRAVPPGHETQPVMREERAQRVRASRELAPELDADIPGLARFVQTHFERDVVAKLRKVVIGPADGIDAEPDRHPTIPSAGAAAPRRTSPGRRAPPDATTRPGRRRPTMRRRRRSWLSRRSR